jgi:hypothetical protein
MEFNSPDTLEIDPTPYAMERYGKVLAKSPFDFDVQPPAPIIPPPPMQGWLLSGLRVTTEFTSVTIVEEKTGSRVTLSKFSDATIAANEKPKSAPGFPDKFVLDRLEFEPNKPKGRKTASAFIRRNSDQAAAVKWDAKVDQLRPAGGVPIMPTLQKGQPIGTGKLGPTPLPIPPTRTDTPTPTPPVQSQTGQAVSGGQAALLELLKRKETQSGDAKTGVGESSRPSPTRRVVIPPP